MVLDRFVGEDHLNFSWIIRKEESIGALVHYFDALTSCVCSESMHSEQDIPRSAPCQAFHAWQVKYGVLSYF